MLSLHCCVSDHVPDEKRKATHVADRYFLSMSLVSQISSDSRISGSKFDSGNFFFFYLFPFFFFLRMVAVYRVGYLPVTVRVADSVLYTSSLLTHFVSLYKVTAGDITETEGGPCI